MNPETENQLLHHHEKTYTEKSKTLEDARSSSVLFLTMGVIGLLFLASVWLGIIPIRLLTYMKVLYTITLGALFLVFLFVGIHYTRVQKELKVAASVEKETTDQIISWFLENYSLETLDAMNETADLTSEQLYFQRSAQISDLISQKVPDIGEQYLDYLVEKLYQIYSPEE